MATGSINNKSQQINARFPHDVVAELENSLNTGEIKRRQRRKKTETPES
ncbi:TPA: hypothetical protein N2G40_002353 [Salmonella enterica]|nr:hypothetical protein [Salmonella enterica]